MRGKRNEINQRACLYVFDTPKMNAVDLIIFDTETTGLKPNEDYIVQLCAKKYRAGTESMTLVDEINLYIRPPFYMDKKVIAVHGITNEFLLDKPFEEKAFKTIQSFFGERSLLMGYNVDFDIGMLKGMYERQGQTLKYWTSLDILEMARDLFAPDEVENYKLGTILQATGLDIGLTFHNAMDDVEGTARLLEYCYEEYKKIAKHSGEKKSLYIKQYYYFVGYRKEQKGIYLLVSTDRYGSGESSYHWIYFSTYYKMWFSKDKGFNLSDKDIDNLEKNILTHLKISNIKEFGKLTPTKWKNITGQEALDPAKKKKKK